MTRYSVNKEKSILTFNWTTPSLSISFLPSIIPPFFLSLVLLLHPPISLFSLPCLFPSVSFSYSLHGSLLSSLHLFFFPILSPHAIFCLSVLHLFPPSHHSFPFFSKSFLFFSPSLPFAWNCCCHCCEVNGVDVWPNVFLQWYRYLQCCSWNKRNHF